METKHRSKTRIRANKTAKLTHLVLNLGGELEDSTDISTNTATKPRRERATDSKRRREKGVENRMRKRRSDTTALSPFNSEEAINAMSGARIARRRRKFSHQCSRTSISSRSIIEMRRGKRRFQRASNWNTTDIFWLVMVVVLVSENYAKTPPPDATFICVTLQPISIIYISEYILLYSNHQ